MFLTICYLSSASENLTLEGIKGLMENVKMFNDTNTVGGILIYSDHTFFQVIEGKHDTVTALFNRIKKDNRHYNILKILEITSMEKKFRKYSTNFITHYKKEASAELLTLLQSQEFEGPGQKLHNLIIYQSKVLFKMY